jgi:hypothetical protein
MNSSFSAEPLLIQMESPNAYGKPASTVGFSVLMVIENGSFGVCPRAEPTAANATKTKDKARNDLMASPLFLKHPNFFIIPLLP